MDSSLYANGGRLDQDQNQQAQWLGTARGATGYQSLAASAGIVPGGWAPQQQAANSNTIDIMLAAQLGQQYDMQSMPYASAAMANMAPLRMQQNMAQQSHLHHQALLSQHAQQQLLQPAYAVAAGQQPMQAIRAGNSALHMQASTWDAMGTRAAAWPDAAAGMCFTSIPSVHYPAASNYSHFIGAAMPDAMVGLTPASAYSGWSAPDIQQPMLLLPGDGTGQLPRMVPLGSLSGALIKPRSHVSRHHRLFRTELCRHWQATGSCSYGAKCQFAHGQGELQPRPLKAAEKAALAAAAVAAAAGQVAGSPSLENGLGSGSIGDGGTMPTVSTSTSTAAIATASADDAGAAKEGRLWEGSPAAVAPDAGAGTAAVDQTHEEL